MKSRKKIFFVPVHLFRFFYNIRVCVIFVGKSVDSLKIIPNTYCGLLYKRPFSNAFVVLNPLCCFYGFTGSRYCFPKRKQAIPMKCSPSNYDRFLVSLGFGEVSVRNSTFWSPFGRRTGRGGPGSKDFLLICAVLEAGELRVKSMIILRKIL